MDPRLANLISSYQTAVAECVVALADAGATLPTRDYDWPPDGFPTTGKLPDGRDYFCHGIGCAVRSEKGRTVDFDFGENGQIDGFDLSGLLTYVGATPQHFGFETREEIAANFEAANSELAFSGSILYYLLPQK